jgi:hypothetical protein
VTSPSSNAGESKPLSVDLASTDCMAESLSEADGGRRWPAAMEMLENWLIGQSGPIVGISFSQEEAAKLTAAAYVIARKAEKPEPFVVRLFEEASSPSVPAPDVCDVDRVLDYLHEDEAAIRASKINFVWANTMARATALIRVLASRKDSPSSDTTSPNEKDGVAPSVPVVHGEGGEQPKNHSFNLGSSGDGPESLSSSGGGVE